MNRAVHIRSHLLSGTFILILLYTLYFTASLILPIILAILLSLVLSPLVRGLAAVFIPPPLGAAIVLLGLIGFVGTGAYLLSGPASEWLQRAPQSFHEVEWKLRTLAEPIFHIQKATKGVEELTDIAEGPPERRQAVVEVRQPSLTNMVLTGTPKALAAIGLVLFLLYFLLASGDTFLRKLVKVIPRMSDKRMAVEIFRHIQQDVSYYLFTITLINICLGIAIAIAMYFLQMPNPMLWGAMTALLNFVPYLGAVISLITVTAVAILTFDNMSHALLVPAVFFGLTSLEGQIITPFIIGRRLSLNPVVVFLFIIIWGWIWGIIGILIAVPLLASIKICCEHIESLNPIAEFLSP